MTALTLDRRTITDAVQHAREPLSYWFIFVLLTETTLYPSAQPYSSRGFWVMMNWPSTARFRSVMALRRAGKSTEEEDHRKGCDLDLKRWAVEVVKLALSHCFIFSRLTPATLAEGNCIGSGANAARVEVENNSLTGMRPDSQLKKVLNGGKSLGTNWARTLLPSLRTGWLIWPVKPATLQCWVAILHLM